MKKKGVAVALGVSATILLGGFGYTAYAKEPEIKTNELTISYGEELHPKLIKTSGDVAKTTFKTKLDKKKLGKQTITVEVENKRGINSQKNITVNVVDKEKPTIQSENKFEVEVGSEFDMKTSVKATDNYDGNVTDKIVVSQFDTKELGEKKVNVSVSDSSKNVTTKEIALHVVDKVKPELNAENKSVFVGDSVNLLNGVTAKDNVDGDITSEIKVEGNVDTNKAGTYDITYKVVDKSNNETTKSIQVDVKEKQVTKVEDKEIVNQVEEKKEVVQKPQPTETKSDAPKQVEQVKEQPKVENKPVQKQVAQEKVVEKTVQKQEVVQQTQQPKQEVKQASKQYAPMKIYFNGKSVTYKNGGEANGQAIIDSGNVASTWGGAETFSGSDGMNTHFIGHSPGVFSGIQGASTFVITDGNGTATTYKTTNVYKSPRLIRGEAVNRITGTGGGERVVFQTCETANGETVWIIEASKVN